MSLTDQQIRRFREDGYLVVDDLIPPDEVERLRSACADPDVVEAQVAKGYEEKTVHLLSITSYHAAFMERATINRCGKIEKATLHFP